MIKVSQRFTNLPAYIPGKPIEVLERELGIFGAIKLASNENPLGPSKKGMAALKAGTQEVYRYPDSDAVLLKEALARKWNVDPNQVIIGNGSDEVIALLARALLLQGDEAIMADPSFSIYRLSTLSCHGQPILIPLTAAPTGLHDLARMARAVTEKTRLIFICNPNNPTGTIVRQEEVLRFLSRLPKQILVVFDEAYAEYVTDPAYPSSHALLKRGFPVIFLRTFSKIYGLAGLRIGYGVGSLDLIALLNRIRQPFNANLLAQRAALAALSDEAHVKKSVELNEAGKRYLYRKFDAMGISYFKTEANFICFGITGACVAPSVGCAGWSLPLKADSRLSGACGTPSKEVYEALLRKGVIIRHIEGPYLRVSIGKHSELQRFVRSLREILEGKD